MKRASLFFVCLLFVAVPLRAFDITNPVNRVLSISKTSDAAEPYTTGIFRVSLPAGIITTEAITVNYSIAGTATPGPDYMALSGSVVIPAGRNGTDLSLNVRDDRVIEATEAVTITLIGGNSASYNFVVNPTGNNSTMSITDNDFSAENGVVRFTKISDAIEGGSNGQYRIALPPGVTSAGDVTLTITTAGTAQTTVDYTLLGLSGGKIVIPAGTNEVFVDVDASNDGIIEGPENVIMTLATVSHPAYPFTIDPAYKSGRVNIIDANAVSSTPLQVIAGSNASEPGGNSIFTLKLAGVATSAWPITVGYRISGSGNEGEDYQFIGNLVIPANSNTVAVNLNVIDDQIIEPVETFTITLLSGSATDGGGNAFIFPPDPVNDDITINIADNDGAAANKLLSVTKVADGAEPGTQGAFVVSLPAGYSSSANILLSVSPSGTAINGTDYSMAVPLLPAYFNNVVVPFYVNNDAQEEPNETVILTLNTAVDGNSFSYGIPPPPGNAAAAIIIDDDDDPAKRVLNVVATSGSEPSTGVAKFAIRLPAGVTAPANVTVNYTITGTATSGTDYTALSGTAVIPAGQPDVSIPLTIGDDQVIEEAETVILTITGGTGGGKTYTVSPTAGSATADITDNDNLPANRVLQVSKTADAAEPVTNGTFRITLPAGYSCSEPINVSYSILGTATAGDDYTALGGSTVIPAGSNGVNVTVATINDEVIEVSENVRLTVGNSASTSFAFTPHATANFATVTISDEDNAIANRTVRATSIQSSAEPSTNGTFRLSLATGYTSAEPVTVNYTMTGEATPGTDYTALTGSAVIPAGSNSVDITLVPVDDQVIENTESVQMTVNTATSPSFGYIQHPTGYTTVINISDDDNIPANLVLAVSSANGAEPAVNGSFTISLPAGITAGEDVTANYTITGTATAGTDYTSLTGSAVIPAGQNSVTVPVTVSNDQVIEGDETVTMTLAGGNSTSFTFTGSTNASATIADDDNTAANRTVTITRKTVASEPATDGAFMVSLPAGITSSEAITVHYTATGTAASGADYTALNGSVQIPAGTNSVDIPVTVKDDSIIEEMETVIATLTGGTSTGFTFTATGNANVTIWDDEDVPANKILTLSKVTDGSEPATNGSFRLSLPAGITAAANITTPYTVAGTATAGGDYTALGGSVVMPAGQNSVTVPVSVIDDQQIEAAETIIITGSFGSSATDTFTVAGSPVTVNIADDDNTTANRTISISKKLDAKEPTTVGRFTVGLPAGVTAPEIITVHYTIAGTATAGTDYTALSGNVQIPAGTNSVDIPLSVTDDRIIEGAETVIATLSSATGTSLSFTTAAAGATLTIEDDESDPGNLVLTVAKITDAAEPATGGSLRVSLPAGTTAKNDVTARYTVSGGAVAGTDYTALTGVVVIPAGSNAADIPVVVTDDQWIESTENIAVTMTGGTAPGLVFTAGVAASAIVSINDDDNANLNLVVSATQANAGEPATNGSFTISLPSGKLHDRPITVQYSIGGSATAGTDYMAITGSATIPVGAGSVQVPVNVLDDTQVETPETVVLTITGGQSTAYTFTAGTPAQATVTIASDDIATGNLAIRKDMVHPSVGPYRLGQDITYRITVTNIGTGVANGAVVTDSLPVQLELPTRTLADRGGVNVVADDKLVRWTIGDMAAGATAQLEITSRISEGGMMVMKATAASSNPDTDPTNNTAVLTLEVEGQDLSFPNVFTPNNDGRNEKFVVGGLEKYQGALYVYNRLGGMVYQSKNYRNDWTGSGLNEGTYFYVLEVQKPDGIKKYKGWVTILR
ncbi:DUF11 domain-containing protein [Chitinophaga lutea]|uniref:DUF11 domain-containing protein n=1 Tax=Chitinophaga lutea TaxID=2488634 RepID=A0A3N4PWQ5_9BACT|nr:Calx-beta domain-containing protein [Chitinophaga lutea]RPE08110.1 DUF11 domain-containing protein [Chitinophaga lutea]